MHTQNLEHTHIDHACVFSSVLQCVALCCSVMECVVVLCVEMHTHTLRHRHISHFLSIIICVSLKALSEHRLKSHQNIFARTINVTGWRRPIGCLKLQVIFRKRAINSRALLRKITYKDKASYGSSPPCNIDCTCKYFLVTFQSML